MPEDELNVLGNKMSARIADLHASTFEKLRVRGRAALLRAM
jgi:hypothetical protein